MVSAAWTQWKPVSITSRDFGRGTFDEEAGIINLRQPDGQELILPTRMLRHIETIKTYVRTTKPGGRCEVIVGGQAAE